MSPEARVNHLAWRRSGRDRGKQGRRRHVYVRPSKCQDLAPPHTRTSGKQYGVPCKNFRVSAGPRVAQGHTREVLLDVIREAKLELYIVSFAAYKVESVVAALKAAAERGTKIHLVLETERVAGGTLTVDAARAFEALRDFASFHIWPTEKRPVLKRGRASLHAKAAIADDRVALVTSANLTGHGMTENMELGLLIRGGLVPGRLANHFRELIAAGVLEEVLS